METDRLRYFQIIAEVGSLTKACEILNISHSGLSKAISTLEREVGAPLFRPLGRGLEITEFGKAVYEKSKEILCLVNSLDSLSKTRELNKIRIGMTEIFSLALVGDIAKDFSKRFSYTEFQEIDSGSLEIKIIDKQIDFGISLVPFPHKEIEYLKIKEAPLRIYYVNPNFRALTLAEIPFVVPSTKMNNNPLSIKSRDGWPMHISRTVAFSAGSLSSALKIVEAGLCAIFMPAFFANHFNAEKNEEHKLLEYKTEFAQLRNIKRDIFLVKQKNQEESLEMKIVAKLIRKLC